MTNFFTDCIRDPSSNTAFQVNRIKLSVTENSIADQKMDLKSHLWKVVTNEVDPKRLISEDIDDLSTPWFESWKRSFLKSFHDTSIGTPNHEFIGCYFGAIYVMTVLELASFRDVLIELQSKVSTNVKWFFSNYIKYFVVIGSPSNPVSNCPQFNELVQMYGKNTCFGLDLSEQGIQVSLGGTIDNQGYVHVNPDTQAGSKPSEVTLDPLSLGQQSEPELTSDVPPMQTKWGKIEEKDIVIDSATSQSIDQCLRRLVIDTLIPWSEKQMKLLEEILRKRKNQGSIFSLSKGLSTLANLRSNTGRSDAIYSLTSDEMVARKAGDLCMSLGLLEIAHKYYNECRKDFQSDGAHLFTAGSSEMVALSSHLLSKSDTTSHHSKSKNSLVYLDQSIGLYLDTCRVDHLATRATILASLLMASLETGIGSGGLKSVEYKGDQRTLASMFIRMTSEENDLHSGLFLEQAAKAFRLNGKNRKSSFHFVLCGHRYNKCGLTSLALISYRRYVCKDWFYSVEHVQYTLSKLYLKSKYQLDSELVNKLKVRGIDTLRKNCDKEIFFQDFKVEAEKCAHLMVNRPEVDDGQVMVSGGQTVSNGQPIFDLDIPFVKSVKREEIEGSFTSRDGRSSCFIHESFSVSLTLWTPFNVEAKNVSLIASTTSSGSIGTSSGSTGTNSTLVNVTSHDLTITPDEMIVKFKITPSIEGHFDIIGLQFLVGNGIICRKLLGEKMVNKLKFNCIKSLPPLELILSRSVSNETLNDVQTIESLSGEVVPLNAIVRIPVNDKWTPSGIKLTTSSGLSMVVQLNQGVTLDIVSPFEPGSHLVDIRMEYFEGTKSRTLTRSIELFVREVLLIENLIHGVISLRNILSTGQSLSVMNQSLSPGLTAHLLVNDSLFVDWNLGSRKGQLRIQDVHLVRTF